MEFAPPTPELPVPDVRAAQVYYRDVLGFSIAWHNEEGAIGAVSRGPCAIFFRAAPDGAVIPTVFWVFVEVVDAVHDELHQRGAEITDPLGDKPWGLRQFTVADPYGNRFHFHHDLEG